MVREFRVAFHSFQDVRDFGCLASAQSFDIWVSSNWQTADAKSLMVMFSLDYRQPLKVSANCSEADFLRFREEAARFVVN